MYILPKKKSLKTHVEQAIAIPDTENLRWIYMHGKGLFSRAYITLI